MSDVVQLRTGRDGSMFYVYGLVDHRTDAIFYIGKGKGNRAWQHADRVRCGRSSGNARKDEIIRQLHAAGLEPGVKIIAEYDDQADAFEHEIELIALTPGLCNIRRGGEGWALSAEEAAKRAVIRAERVEHYRRRQTHKVLSKLLARVDTWPHGVTFPGMPDGDQKASEYIGMVRQIVAQYSVETTII